MNIFQRFYAIVTGGWFDKRLWTQTGGSRTTTSRIDVSEDSALNYAAVWCATRLICGTGASLPFPIYSGRDDETRVKERSHPVYKLLNGSPNPEQTAYNFRSVMWQWQVNWGNAYAEIVREGNNPLAPVVALWPLHPSRVTPKRDNASMLYYEVRNLGGGPTELDPWQMLHIPSILTCDGLVGMGVVEHARETIGAGLAAEKQASHSFGGGKLPAVVVEHQGTLTDDKRASFRKEWKEIYGSADGDEVALLGGGAVAKPLGFSAQDSQFLESRMFDIEEVARWYGIPPHLLQHLLRATFNNIEELGIDFVRYGLNLWLKVWEQSVWQKLLTPDEQETMFAEHNVDALLRGNAAARSAFYQAMTNAAIMSRNECRKLENLDPVDGGDVFLVQGATVPLDDDGKPESQFVSGGAGQPASAPTPNDDPPSQPDNAAEEIKASVAAKINRVLHRDLARMLTKESLRVAEYAKKHGNFVSLVDSFYAEHAVMIGDVVLETVGALSDCGIEVSRETLVAEWVREGKSLVLEAAGTATPDELPAAVQRVIESKSWSERPLRAIERVGNATLVV